MQAIKAAYHILSITISSKLTFFFMLLLYEHTLTISVLNGK